MTKCFLSIDFEDFSHDLKRNLGIDLDGSMRVEALWNSYFLINDFIEKKFPGHKVTFFVTGILAKKCPEIVKKIAQDGHEIACHYFWHDLVYKDTLDKFEDNLKKAIFFLESASNKKIVGFRAPVFSIRSNDFPYYKVLEKYFLYDSSMAFSSCHEVRNFKFRAGIQNLSLLPVAFRSLPFSRFKIRSGGTFLKFFPASTLVSILKSCDSEGIVPMLYLHPYEFITDNSFVLGLGDMGSLPFYKKYYWLLRQFQWLGFTNSSVQGRILSIYEHFEMGGHMKSLLKSC